MTGKGFIRRKNIGEGPGKGETEKHKKKRWARVIHPDRD